MPGSANGPTGVRWDPVRLAPAWLVAALPGLVVLQVLPRLVDDAQRAAAAGVLGWAGTLLPLAGAAVAGLIAAAATGGGGAAGLRAGWAAQVPALPGFWAIQAGLFERSYYIDALVFAGLLFAHVTLSTWAAGHAGRWWASLQDEGPAAPFGAGVRGTLGLVVAGLGFLALAVIVLSNPLAPLPYAVVLSLAAGALGFTVWQGGSGPAHSAGVPMMMAGIAVAAFGVSLMSGELLPPLEAEASAS